MKKLIVSAVIVCAAVAANAAAISWNGSTRLFGVNPDSVLDNGSYSMGSGTANRMDSMTLTYTLQILDASTDALVGSANGSMTTDKGKAMVDFGDISGVNQGTTYKYSLTLTGTQNSLSSKAKATEGGYEYDYAGAIVTTTLDGTIDIATMGGTDFPNVTPSSWAVTGITKTATGGGGGTTDAPEPTSGLLLLVGAGMLALRRKQK